MKVKFVIFRKELIALFPKKQFNHWNKQSCMSYARIGQHSEASKRLMKCKKASKEEYSNLLQELVSIGYDNLIVMNEK